MEDRTLEQWIAQFHGLQLQGVDLVCVMCGLRLCLKRVRFYLDFGWFLSPLRSCTLLACQPEPLYAIASFRVTRGSFGPVVAFFSQNV